MPKAKSSLKKKLFSDGGQLKLSLLCNKSSTYMNCGNEMSFEFMQQRFECKNSK